ncbi:MAG: acyl-CoA dehydrogenase family protein [Gracilibacteraceae bacterium]|jgi:butyryl-CoA dehydrogenase|nr:acyl-CoA dehydrogenase family protein [Gracilibacteraceae bacterium]
MYDMTLSQEEQLMLQSVREYSENVIAPAAKEADATGEFPWDVVKKGIELGLHALPIPEAYGGAGISSVLMSILAEEMSKACAGIATTLGATGLSCYPVLIAGNEEQKKLYFDTIMAGALGAFCLTEPGAGSDSGSVAATAERDGGDYVLNGSKTFITNGGVAGIYTVFATVDRSRGLKGLSAFMVERGRAGLSVGKEENKMGIRASNTTDVVFTNVRVPASHLLGREGDGFKIAMTTLDRSRHSVGAQAVGICQAALEASIRYANERKQFGKPIGANQAIQFMLADMATQTEAARWLVRRAAWLQDQGLPYSMESAMAKTFAGDTAMQVTTDAVQIFGGYGYSRDYPIEKLMRDAKIMQIFEGTNQIQRVVIAGRLLKA